MSYKLEKPYTENERLDFIIKYNHKNGLRIEETDKAFFALEKNEILVENEPVIDITWEEKEALKEAERIAKLKLTKREVFLALYKDCGVTPEQIKSGITDNEALIEFEYANEYYRGNPLIDIIGNSLGYSKEELDYLFEYKNFKGGVKNA